MLVIHEDEHPCIAFDYLGVDRSALSAELSRMQKAGLIETRRSHFILK